VPAVVGKQGIEKIIELDLSSQTRERFEKSVAIVKEAIAALKS
jgi:malate dehydrogenase